MKFYQRLRDIREDNEITQDQIAKVLNTAREQYHKYESGKQELPMHHFITLAKYYNVSLDYLAGLTNTPRTLDGSPYKISKKITVRNISGGHNKFEIH